MCLLRQESLGTGVKPAEHESVAWFTTLRDEARVFAKRRQCASWLEPCMRMGSMCDCTLWQQVSATTVHEKIVCAVGVLFLQESDKMDTSEIHAKRFSAKEVLTSKKMVNILTSRSQTEQQNCLEETRFSENTSRLGINLKEAKSSEMVFEENRTGLDDWTQ